LNWTDVGPKLTVGTWAQIRCFHLLVPNLELETLNR
jgi:hypothetical protein